jgi:hypothetical protein
MWKIQLWSFVVGQLQLLTQSDPCATQEDRFDQARDQYPIYQRRTPSGDR